MIKWLRLHPLNAGGLGSIPVQGNILHMSQLRVHIPQLKDPTHLSSKRFDMLQLKILCAVT